MKVSSGEDLSIGRCLSNKADMPMICFCQDVGVDVSEIALYIFLAVSIRKTYLSRMQAVSCPEEETLCWADAT